MSDFPIVHAVTDSSVVLRDSFVSRAMSVMRALGPIVGGLTASTKLMPSSHAQRSTSTTAIGTDRLRFCQPIGISRSKSSNSFELGNELCGSFHGP